MAATTMTARLLSPSCPAPCCRSSEGGRHLPLIGGGPLHAPASFRERFPDHVHLLLGQAAAALEDDRRAAGGGRRDRERRGRVPVLVRGEIGGYERQHARHGHVHHAGDPVRHGAFEDVLAQDPQDSTGHCGGHSCDLDFRLDWVAHLDPASCGEIGGEDGGSEDGGEDDPAPRPRRAAVCPYAEGTVSASPAASAMSLGWPLNAWTRITVIPVPVSATSLKIVQCVVQRTP